MALWMIHIVPGAKPGDLARFVPQLVKPGPNGEAYASATNNDQVNWFNRTGESYQPQATTDSSFLTPMTAPPGHKYYLSDLIRSNSSSSPNWNAVLPPSGNTLYYRCALHPNVHGMIIIT